MRRTLILAAMAAILAGPAQAEPPADFFRYRSVAVTDGDTIIVPASGSATGWRVRAWGYDTPEIAGDCAYEKDLAQKAKARVVELTRGGLDVLSGLRVEGRARFLAVLRLPDGRDLGSVLVSEGLARFYDGKTARKPWCPGATMAAPEID